jgi:hypothetical protein
LEEFSVWGLKEGHKVTRKSKEGKDVKGQEFVDLSVNNCTRMLDQPVFNIQMLVFFIKFM